MTKYSTNTASNMNSNLQETRTNKVLPTYCGYTFREHSRKQYKRTSAKAERWYAKQEIKAYIRSNSYSPWEDYNPYICLDYYDFHEDEQCFVDYDGRCYQHFTEADAEAAMREWEEEDFWAQQMYYGEPIDKYAVSNKFDAQAYIDGGAYKQVHDAIIVPVPIGQGGTLGEIVDGVLKEYTDA